MPTEHMPADGLTKHLTTQHALLKVVMDNRFRYCWKREDSQRTKGKKTAKINTAQNMQDKEAKNATAPLGDSDDDRPLVRPKNTAKAKAKAVKTRRFGR